MCTPGQHRGHHKIVIVGGGSAGISVASRLRRAGETDVAVVDPSTTHYYSPLWTLVGGGCSAVAKSARPQSDVIPPRGRHQGQRRRPQGREVRARHHGCAGDQVRKAVEITTMRAMLLKLSYDRRRVPGGADTHPCGEGHRARASQKTPLGSGLIRASSSS